MTRRPFTRTDMAKLLLCWPFYIMLCLMVIEALLAATTTWLVIRAGRDIADGEFLFWDLIYILCAQSASYVIGAISWIYAERAGFLAFGRYILRFARDNRGETKVLGDKAQREVIEPFLTSETFDALFDLLSEIEGNLRLFLALIFNVIVLGTEIDASFPVAYAAVLISLLLMQITMRKRIAEAYLNNQRMTNRMTSQGYTAWDNVFSGNRHNLRLWTAGFKARLRDGVAAQIKAIMTREGLSAASGIVGLSIVFATMVYIASKYSGDTGLLIGLAATLPRQIELTHEVHLLASGWNDFLAAWTRIGGAVDHMHPNPADDFDRRVKYDRLLLKEGEETRLCGSLDEALTLVWSQPTGRITVRGANGAGKSTLLAMLKSEIKNRAYYWPTADRLAFEFHKEVEAAKTAADDDEDDGDAPKTKPKGFSSGERQLRALREIVAYTDAAVYLLDEWDANLDAKNRAAADAMVEQLAARARVIEISHRDRDKK
jgi:ABC-type transport system involved in cytochrome c biogenesis ATPase subunit